MKNALLLFLFFAAFYLVSLGGRPLVAPDEFRYAQIPYEMLESGNFAAPQMFGHPYFEKPALGHWLTAASFKLFGFNAFAIRFPSAFLTGITALFTGLLIYAALRDKRLSVLGAVMYLCCGMVYGIGVFAVLDAQVTMFSTGAALCAFLYLQKERPLVSKIIMLILCGIFCGLGFMVKGVPAWVVPALGTAGFIVWQKRWKEFLIMPWLPLLFTVLTILPWAICVHRADGDFWRYFIEIEHIQRFTRDTSGQHPEPWWFLLPFFVIGAFPAALLLVSCIGSVKAVIKMMQPQPLYRFAACSAILPLILFSCSSGKLATYILPCFPGVAILMAGAVATALRNYGRSEKNLEILFSVCGWLFAAVGILAVPAGYIMRFFFEQYPRCSCIAPLVLAAGASAAAAGVMLLLSAKKPVRVRLWFFAMLFVLPAMVVPFFIDWRLKEYKMPGPVLEDIKQQLGIRSGVHIVTRPSLMHAAAWSFKTCDLQLYRSVGEVEYADERAAAEGRRRLKLEKEEYIKLLNTKKRKGIVCISFTDRPFPAVPGRKPESKFTCGELTVRYFPADIKISQDEKTQSAGK